MKVLVVKTSSMGDVIHTLPALTDAALALPGIRFDWVVEGRFAEIPAWHEAVDRVIRFDLRKWRGAPHQPRNLREGLEYFRSLRRDHYDAVIDAQGLFKSAFFVSLLSRGTRYGLDITSARERVAAIVYNKRIPVARNQHAVERVRQLFAQSLGYELPATRGDFGIARHFAGGASSPYLVFLHATTRADKHWPEAYWVELAGRAQLAGWMVKLPWGTNPERDRALRISQASANVKVLPGLTLTQAASELAGAAAVVSVDTGLSHLAAALDRPNVILFGPTDPGLVGGYGKDQICLQSRDFPAESHALDPSDLAALTPDIVWDQLLQLLGRTAHSAA